MIIATTKHQVEMGGIAAAPSEFKILNSAAAFGILSSGLYSDKITAVAREVICNAWDGHKAAGKLDHPIEIHLPTALEPWFSVKDQGTGLKHEDMVDLYTTYFASTKSQANDDIGGFGLGCKSPFAYTSGFDVVSIQDGIMRTYTAMLSESGVPVIVLTGEDATDEPAGITVSMAVKQQDMNEFRVKTAKVLELFPAFKTNLTDFKAFRTVYSHKGEGWAIRDRHKNEHLSNVPRAIVGKVAYRFPVDSIQGLTADHKNVLALPIDLIFEIGDLDVTPSRESLSMTKRTIQNIKERMDSIHNSILESLRLEIQSAPSLWAAKLALRERLANGNPFKPLVQAVIKTFFAQYQNFVLDDISTQVNIKQYQSLTIIHRAFKTRSDKMTKAVNLKDESNHRNLALIETSDNVVFYMNDDNTYTPKLTKRLLSMYQDEGREVTLYLIDPYKGTNPKQVSKDFAGLVSELGDPEVLFSSDLPPVPKKARGYRAPTDTIKFAWVMKDYDSRNVREDYEKAKQEDIDGEGPFFYFPVDRLDAQVPGLSDKSEVNRLWKACKLVGVTVETEDDSYEVVGLTKLFGLNAVGIAKVAEDPRFINFFTYLRENPPVIPDKYLENLAVRAAALSVDESATPRFFQNNKGDKKVCNLVRHTEFYRQGVIQRRVVQLINRAVSSTPMNNAWMVITAFTKQEVDVKKSVPAVITKLMKALDLKQINRMYPMLQYLENPYYRNMEKGFVNTVCEYIANIG